MQPYNNEWTALICSCSSAEPFCSDTVRRWKSTLSSSSVIICFWFVLINSCVSPAGWTQAFWWCSVAAPFYLRYNLKICVTTCNLCVCVCVQCLQAESWTALRRAPAAAAFSSKSGGSKKSKKGSGRIQSLRVFISSWMKLALLNCGTNVTDISQKHVRLQCRRHLRLFSYLNTIFLK